MKRESVHQDNTIYVKQNHNVSCVRLDTKKIYIQCGLNLKLLLYLKASLAPTYNLH